MTEALSGKVAPPWRSADWWALTDLLLEGSRPKPKPVTPSSFMRGPEGSRKAETEALKEATRRIKGQKLYKQLCADRNFSSARRLFLKQAGLPYTKHPATRREFEFLVQALSWVEWCFRLKLLPTIRQRADSVARKQAMNALSKLSRLRARGMRLPDPHEDRTLVALLTKLEGLMIHQRRPYESAATSKTGLVEKLAETLFERFEITSHRIALELAELAELDLDESAVRKSFDRRLQAIHEKRLRESAHR